jgi:hypothetical protein
MMTTEENVKDVLGYEGIYKISNCGTVFNYLDKPIKYHIVNGYKRVTLIKNKCRKSFLIHRIVAMAFLPNPKRKKSVNHLNSIRSDNRAENLAWCTAKENTAHAISKGVIIGRQANNGNKDFYIKIKRMLISGQRIVDIKNKLNTTYQTVSNIKYGISHKYLSIK